RRAHARNLVALGVEGIRLLDIVAVALLVAVQVADIAGNQHTLDVVPGASADARARIDTRRVTALFLAEIGVPRALGGGAADGLGLALAKLVGTRKAAKVARAIRVLGNKEARQIRVHLRLLLGLRQHRRRTQKRDSHGGKNDRSR